MTSTHPKTYLVTGAAGFIGSTFAELAIAQGKRVIALDALTYSGHRENLAHLEGSPLFEFIHGDICDGAVVEEVLRQHRPDAVVNFAAESHVDRSIDSPSSFIETNIRGVFVLLNASLNYWRSLVGERHERFRYLQISTDEVFGSLGAHGKFSETTPLAPNSPYSASKASADLLTRAWHHTYGLPTLTTNCSNNYGPRQFPEKLIPHMIFCALEGKPLPVYGDGANIRDWIHVEDHAHGVLLALERGKPGGSYCFGGNAEKSNIEVVKAICSALDRLHPRSSGMPYENLIHFVKDRPGHDRRYAIDDHLAARELGFKRKYTFDQGLAATVNWYLAHESWRKIVTTPQTTQRIGLGPEHGKGHL